MIARVVKKDEFMNETDKNVGENMIISEKNPRIEIVNDDCLNYLKSIPGG